MISYTKKILLLSLYVLLIIISISTIAVAEYTSDECVNCHDSQLPDPHFNANHISNSYCIGCHDADITVSHFNNCDACHRNNAIDMTISTNQCESCHVTQDIGFHIEMDTNHTSSTTDCITCHETDLPTVHLDDCMLCHDNPIIDINNATADCNSCHLDQNIGFHENADEKHKSPSDCVECHNHDADLTITHTGNCALCHGNTSIIATLPNNANCESCHGAQSQLGIEHINEYIKHNVTSMKADGCLASPCHDTGYIPTLHENANASYNCLTCHNADPTRIDWRSGNINSSCDSCHTPHGDVNELHNNMTSSSCYDCHEDIAGSTDIRTVHNDNCTACHNNANVVYTGVTDCNSCHVDQNIGFHTDMSAKHTNTSSCTNCHQDSYLPDLHNDIALENGMTNCTICHKNTAVNTNNATSDCITCHGQQLPTQHANEVTKHTDTDYTACTMCHGNSDFETYLPVIHNATEENDGCNWCHNNDLINISISDSNCDSCHGPQISEDHHNESVKHTFESPTECEICHDMYIPITHADQYNNVNCFMCHRNNPAITELPTDKNCTSCHGEQLPVQHLNETIKHNGSSLSGCLDCHESSAGSNDLRTIHNDNCTVCHDNTNVNYLGVTDCMDCHADSNVGYHANMDNNHTTTICANCHGESGTAILPTVHNDNCSLCHNNPAITLPTSADCGYCHGSQTPDADHHNNELSISHTFDVPEDCAGCHDMNLMETHSTQSLNCDMCHTTHGGSGPNLFVDFANAASVEGTNCFVCHDNADITTLPTDKNCSSCHDSQLPMQHVNESTKHNSSTLTDDCIVCHSTNYLPTLHEDYNYNCTTCHNADVARIDWINDTITSSCDSCHTGHGDLDVLHDNMTSSECISCHESIANSTDLRNIHNDNCTVCHSNANVVYTSVTDCTDCHSDSTSYHVNESSSHSFTKCNICHSQAYTGEGDVPTVHNATLDNGGCEDICHANSAINMSIVDTSYAYYCNDCHGGLPDSPLPSPHDGQVDGHNFGSSVSTECMACHDNFSNIAILHLPAGVNTDYWTCVECHDSNLDEVNYNFNELTFLPTDKNCSSCHDSQLSTQHENEAVKHNSTTLTTECLNCHNTNYIPDLHESEGYDCNTCHNNANTSRIDWASENINSSCDSCHTGHGDITVIHTTNESKGCANCHDTSVITTHNDACSTCHGSTLIPTLPSTVECTECHGANAPLPAHNFRGNPSYHPTEITGTNDMISSQAFVNGWTASDITGCDDCHGERAADGSITLLKPYSEMYPDGRHNGQSSSDLCFDCHNYNTYAGNSNSDSNFVGDGGKNLHPGNFGDHGDFGCYACHDVHTSTNRRLITDRVDPKTGDQWMTSWVQNSGSYDEDDCVSSHPECGDHNPGSGTITPAIITGTVTYNGSSVQNAKVSSDAYGGIVAYTDASGHYEIPNLYYGTYSLTATANGMSQTTSISVNQGDSKVLNIDLSGALTPPEPPFPPTDQPVSGEGYILSKNPDFSTDDREYSRSDTIYVKIWSNQVDYTDMYRMSFQIRDVTTKTLTNNYDGSFTASYDLESASSGERDVNIRLEDDYDEEYLISTKINIMRSSYDYYRR